MRELQNWLTAYREYTEPQESPPDFHFWCGVSTLAMAVGRKIKLDLGAYTLYPNMYVMLMAESAWIRKSGAVHLAEKLIREAGVSVIAGRVTAPVVILHGQRAFGQSGAADFAILSDEMRNQWHVGDEETVSLLTQLYDSRDYWDNETIGRGYEELYNVCINILLATTPAWAALALPKSSMAGGFWGRVIVVASEDFSKRKSLPLLDKRLRLKLLNDLLHIRQLTGEMTYDQDAWDYYDNWYISIRSKKRILSSMDGAAGRVHDHALKLAMVLTIAESDNLIIDLNIMQLAIQIIENLYLGIPPEILSEKPEQQNARKVRQKIEKFGTIFHSDLLRLVSHGMDSSDLAQAIRYLSELGEVDQQLVGRKTVYVWKG